MSLILCPECKHEISDRALSCPNCGFSFHHQVVSSPQSTTPPLHGPPKSTGLPAPNVPATVSRDVAPVAAHRCRACDNEVKSQSESCSHCGDCSPLSSGKPVLLH